jgi:cytochrome b561
MQIKNTRHAWGVVQKSIHWFVVVAVISQLTIGFIFAGLPENDPAAGTLFGIHTSIGVIILITMLTRFLWRQANPVPDLPDTLSSGQKKLAIANHWALYALLIGLPLAGYLMVNAGGFPVPFFGIDLPVVIQKDKNLGDIFLFLHVWGAFVLIGLMLLHVAAALRHEFLLKDNTLRRMTPLPLREGTASRSSGAGKPVVGTPPRH